MNNELLTKRLRLTPVTQKDCSQIFDLLNSDKIKRYLCDNKSVELEFVNRMIRNSKSLFKQKGIGIWKIFEKINNFEIGFCGFLENNAIELIYVIHPDYQNKGFATESILKAIEFLCQQKVTSSVIAKVDFPNLASHRVAQKIGMKEIGTEKNMATDGDMKIYNLKLS